MSSIPATERIAQITLDEGSIIRRAPEIEHERMIALTDLTHNNRFSPAGLNAGPYTVFLSVRENRLKFEITSEDLEAPYHIVLPITPLKKIIKDYFLICESYFTAIKTANTYRVEAVDIGRRGVHNEGSELLQDLLKDKIEMDFDTTRRLFTLICVLHIK